MTTTKKLIVSKGQLRMDIMYVRALLRQVETTINNNDWKQAEEIFQEIGALGATHEGSCADNFYGIENAYDEINSNFRWEKE
jgi:hypothetical protein|tara:strand:- start:433 stop:678 length:246 start_codon:yes stop_codon:yes gene_type:complete